VRSNFRESGQTYAGVGNCNKKASPDHVAANSHLRLPNGYRLCAWRARARCVRPPPSQEGPSPELDSRLGKILAELIRCLVFLSVPTRPLTHGPPLRAEKDAAGMRLQCGVRRVPAPGCKLGPVEHARLRKGPALGAALGAGEEALAQLAARHALVRSAAMDPRHTAAKRRCAS